MRAHWAIPVLVSILILGALGFSPDAYAANLESNGTGGGSWTSAATWAGGIVPNSGEAADTITIKSGDTVTLSIGFFSCNDIFIIESGARLDISNSGFLAVTCPTSIFINHGTVVVDGRFIVAIFSKVINEATMEINGDVHNFGTFVNYGTININSGLSSGSGAILSTAMVSKFVNNCGAEINLIGSASDQSAQLKTGNGLVVNIGTINLSGGTGSQSGSWLNEDITNKGFIYETPGAGSQSGIVLSPSKITNNQDCNTSPVVTASLEQISGDNEEGRFRVAFSATDVEKNIASVVADINGTPVENGQVVEFELDNEAEVEYDELLLMIGPSFTLTVTATDSGGLSDTATNDAVYS